MMKTLNQQVGYSTPSTELRARLFLASVILSTSLLGGTQLMAACVPPPSGMVAWWPLDETSGPTAFDLAGIHQDNGIHTNSPTPTPGKVQGALCFNGINQYVEVADHAEINFGTGDFSIDGWIRTTDKTGVKIILDKIVNTPAFRGYELYLYNGNLGLQLADGTYTNWNSIGFVADGTWRHFAVTVDRDNPAGIIFYLDGAPVGPTLNPTARLGSLTNTSALRMACRAFSLSGFLNGCLDEIEILSRALSEAEIKAIYDAGSAGKCKCVPPPSGMVAWWPLDETWGTTVTDIVGGLNGTAGPADISTDGGQGQSPWSSAGWQSGFFFPQGKVGTSLFFWGYAHIKVPHDPRLDPGMGSFTVDAWVAYDVVSPAGVELLVIQKYLPSPPSGWYLLLRRNTVLFEVNGLTATQFTDNSVTTKDWHHVAAVLDRDDGTIKLYWDGLPVASTTLPTGLVVATSADLFIGSNGDHIISGQIAVDEVEIFKRALSEAEIDLIYDADSAGKCKPAEALADLGDAPDSTNHAGRPMNAYTNVDAHFPTVYDPNLAGNAPLGPMHRQYMCYNCRAWLGVGYSFENDADLLQDQDGVTNIDPTFNTADRDANDDGVIFPINLPPCGPTHFQYQVTAHKTLTLYINAWFDFNRDGDWEDTFRCAEGPTITGLAREWAVQNEPINVVSGLQTLTTPDFVSFNPAPGGPIWMRITLTDAPIDSVNGADGSGPLGGYPLGETEDYLVPESNTVCEICGIKFNDLNGNGVQDLGEPGLPNWTITATGPNGIVTTVTDLNGNYWITVPVGGTYTVAEQDQPYWMSTTQNLQTVTVQPGQTVNVQFGNKATGQAEICVFKFNDLNGNGVKDSSEPWLTGWTFDIKDIAGNLIGSVTTAEGEPACLTVPAQGTYTITEQVQPNWTPTLNPQTVTVYPGQTAYVYFGNKATGEGEGQICVSKFNDLNGNGVYDSNEPGALSGWKFDIRDSGGSLIGTVTTSRGGPGCLTVPAPGTYTITEQVQPGWTPTTQNPQTVTVQPGQTVNVQFGNKATGQGQICVTKFNDINGNGVQDPGEASLFHWTFEIKDVSGSVVAALTTVPPGPAGSPCPGGGTPTIVPAPGTYTITEQVQSNWTPTTQNPQTVTVQPGQTVNVQFGNKATGQGQICVFKFNDINGNGVQDSGEPPLFGWKFDIKDILGNLIGTVTTMKDLPSCLTVPAPGTYTITEQVQSNWTPTTTNPQTVTVQPGQTVNVWFGNKATGQGEICVGKFNDINGNGVQDTGEYRLAGWKFDIRDIGGNLLGTVTTDNLGRPGCLTVPAPGTYTITEQVKSSWAPTTPNPQTVTVQVGETVNVWFGNKAI